MLLLLFWSINVNLRLLKAVDFIIVVVVVVVIVIVVVVVVFVVNVVVVALFVVTGHIILSYGQ